MLYIKNTPAWLAGVFTYARLGLIIALALAGACLADLLERREAMITIPLTYFELIYLCISAFVAYTIFKDRGKK